MNTIPSESDSNAILDRLLSGAGLHRDAQLAALLGVSPQAVSQARRKRKIPEGWVVKVSQQCGLSMDWLMFGKGDESTPVASHAPVASSISQGVDACGCGGSGSRPVVHPSGGGEPFRRSGKPANRSRCTGLFCLSFRLAVPEGQSRQDGAHEGLW